MVTLVCGILALQMLANQYPANHSWLTVVFISIGGTLLAGISIDHHGVSLVINTIV